MKIQFGETVLEPAVLSERPLVSPHTGRHLQSVTIEFKRHRNPSPEIKELIAKAKRDGVHSVDDEGSRECLWSVSERRTSFRNDSYFQTVQWELTEVETVQANRLLLQNIEFVPDKYRESLSGKAIEIVATATIPEPKWQDLIALFTTQQELRVVRCGVNDTPLLMNLSEYVWGHQGDDVRVGIVLYERETQNSERKHSRDPIGRTISTLRWEHAELSAQMESLLDSLQAKGILDEEARAQIQTVSDDEFGKHTLRLDRIVDVDRYLGLD